MSVRKKDRAQRFLALRQAGRTLKEIGAAESPPLSESMVSRVLKKVGRPAGRLPTVSATVSAKRRPVTRANAEEMSRLHQSGLTFKAIGEAQDPPLSRHAVCDLLVRFGLWTATPVAELVEGGKARAAAFWAKLQAGKSAEEIGAEENPAIAASTVLNKLRKYGYQPRAFFAEERAARNWALYLHGYSLTEIGALQDPPITAQSVGANLRLHGYNTRAQKTVDRIPRRAKFSPLSKVRAQARKRRRPR